MKLGIAHVPRAGVRETVAAIIELERLGFDRAWLPDQPFFLDPYPLLGAAALATTRIGLGLGVTNPSTAHPVLIARAAATVADAAPGRFVLGIGSGNRREFLSPLGLPADRAPERCAAAVRVVQQLLNGETVVHRSDFFVVDGVRLSFVPTPVPVYLAAMGPKMLEAAGEVADGVIIHYASEQLVRFALASHRRGVARSGRTSTNVVAWARAIVTRDIAAAHDQMRPGVAHTLGSAAPDVFEVIGVPRAVRDSLQAAYRSGGPTAAAQHVSDAMIEHFAWIGTEGQIVERVRALRALGVTEAVLIIPHASSEELLETGRKIARGAGLPATEQQTMVRETT